MKGTLAKGTEVLALQSGKRNAINQNASIAPSLLTPPEGCVLAAALSYILSNGFFSVP